MAKKNLGEATPALVALHRAGIDVTAHAYDHDPHTRSYGLEAADALDLEHARVFKTLMIDVDGTLAVAVVPVSGSLDLKRAAAALDGKRAQLADAAAAQRATGYVLGGISPFGQKRQHRTVVDASALTHSTVFVSGGRRGLDLEVAPADLIAQTRAVTARIAR
ncbi:Cys-tRNA(Pro)/Cys-tRNA(Cys) deacylase [Aeromicrobium flavum]|uniref:Cys-tRNA(Pro)/Cys-tRNA(Cys) deacylase n=1 Tax=Aeromicrobium flavum TaxID=416568 RepID=A0A512HQR7_9ACTN|nr:Cys-tRNA(Pro) deacylase [Aeromicrobium flavum]GEO87802.1 Cys-tRNA(Pro)/Cys-tRNA(Cys) deacylase [Aeromicrobium flavum]